MATPPLPRPKPGCPNCGSTEWTIRTGLGLTRPDGKPSLDICNVCSPAKPRPAYWKVTRGAWAERWRFGIYLRIFHGFGLPKFEFEFRFGFPRERKRPGLWLTYEDDDA